MAGSRRAREGDPVGLEEHGGEVCGGTKLAEKRNVNVTQTPNKPQKSLLERWRALPLWISLLILTAISMGIMAAGNGWGVAHDCGVRGVPRDGQCGLATAMGNVFGTVGGGLFFLIGVAITLISGKKKRAGGTNESRGS